MNKFRFRPSEWAAVAVAVLGFCSYFLAAAVPWQFVSKQPSFIHLVELAGAGGWILFTLGGITLALLVASRRSHQ